MITEATFVTAAEEQLHRAVTLRRVCWIPALWWWELQDSLFPSACGQERWSPCAGLLRGSAQDAVASRPEGRHLHRSSRSPSVLPISRLTSVRALFAAKQGPAWWRLKKPSKKFVLGLFSFSSCLTSFLLQFLLLIFSAISKTEQCDLRSFHLSVCSSPSFFPLLSSFILTTAFLFLGVAIPSFKIFQIEDSFGSQNDGYEEHWWEVTGRILLECWK